MVTVNELQQAEDKLFRQTKGRMDYIIQSRLRSRGGVSVGTQSIQYMLNNEIETYINGVRKLLGFAAVASMDQITSSVIQKAGSDVADAMLQFATAAKTRVARREGLARVHETVANEARQAVLSSYDQNVEARPHLHYRGGQGRFPYRMRLALQRSDVILAQRDGILFGNTAVLDATAVHWRRLNFGAGGLGSYTRTRPAPVVLGGQVLARVPLRFDMGPSAPFSMPPGLWFTGEGALRAAGRPKDTKSLSAARYGDDAFYPIKLGLRRATIGRRNHQQFLNFMNTYHEFLTVSKQTRGIRGYNFFQAGLNVLGRRLPDEYYKLAQQWLKEASDEVQPRGPIAAARGLR